MISWLAEFIEKKTFTLGIIVCSLCLFSFASWFKIPIEVMPREQTPAFVYVRINHHEELNPENIEGVLGRKVESSLRTIPKVVRFSSSLDSKGGSFSLYLEPGTDIDYTILLLQESFQDLEMQQVLAMKNVSFSKLNPEAQEILKVGIESGEMTREQFLLTVDEMKTVIESWVEVSKVEVSGLPSDVYRLRLPWEKVSSLKITPQHVSQALDNREFRENIGQIQIGDAQTKLSMTSLISAVSLDQILERPLSASQPISMNQMSSVVRYDTTKEEWRHKNGKPVVFFEVFTRDNADLFEFHKKFKDLESTYKKKNIDVDTVLDRVENIQDALAEVFSSLYQALLITCGIVFIFYRDLRRTVLVCISIPITLALTVAIMFVDGESLNILSLSGLILGIGMVVDNAILVLDRADELYLRLGRFAAAGQAAADVFTPLLLSTLTNAIIFLPVAFVEGGDSFTDLIKALQIPILASLAASLVIALFVIPFCVILWPPVLASVSASDSKNRKLEDIFRWIQSKQMEFSFIVVIASLIVFNQVRNLEQSDLESAPDPFVKLLVRFTHEVSLEQKKEYYRKIDQQVLSAMPVLDYRFVVSEFSPEQNNGSWTFYFRSHGDLDLETLRMKTQLTQFLGGLPVLAGSHLSIGWDSWGGGKSKKFKSYEISGPETSTILAIQKTIAQELRSIPGVQDVTFESEERGQRELRFRPQAAHPQGIQSRQLASLYGGVFNSASVSFPGNTELKIQFSPRNTKNWDLDQLEQLVFPLPKDGIVSSKDLGLKSTQSVSRNVGRNDGVGKQKLFVYFDENLDPKNLNQSQNQVQQAVSNFEFPKGYGLAKNESSARIEEMQQKSLFILLLSTFLIYLILASIFESILVPIGMMLTVPLALLFGCFGLYLFSFDLDVMARLALVILVGTCVNNAIIIIDLIRNLQVEGLSRQEAIVQGCSKRFKAVMLSTMIQVVSVLPVAFGQSKIMGIPYSTLGIVIIFGIVFSTFVTLVVLPLVYQVLDRLESSG